MTAIEVPQVSPRQKHVREFDWMMLAVVALCCLGLVMAVSVLGPNSRLGPMRAIKQQGIELLIGLVGFILAAVTPMHLMRRLALPGFVLIGLACWSTRFIAVPWNHAYRWIQIGSFQFQPVEGAKFALVILVAHLLAKAGREVFTFRHGFLPVMGAVAFLAGGLMLQPDHGSALLAIAIAAAMALVAGVRVRHFIVWCGGLGLPLFVYLGMQHGYVTGRVQNFLDIKPDSQVGQSLVAIASGGVFGRGLGEGWMKMGFVAEADSDFVFSVIAEELGFCGSMLVLSLYSVFGIACYCLIGRIQDSFLRFVVCGFAILLLGQATINLLVVSGCAPAKGIDLPFVSTGGTSLFFCLAAVGVMGNAARTDLSGSPKISASSRSV
jgi:cell division protein FtsW